MMLAGANSQTAPQMFYFTSPPIPNKIISNYSRNSFERQPLNVSYFSGDATSINLSTRNSQHNGRKFTMNTEKIK